MNKFRFVFKAFALVVFAFATTSLVQAQATRTWVSGVGDDANPCSRTAPCKTFAGAISKTATGGEIDALDPGGFGTLTITKAITVDGGTGQGWASILASGGINGININSAGSKVTLRNLSINGAGTQIGAHGISATAVGVLNVENCVIFGFNNEGLLVALGSGANVNVRNCTFRNNGAAGGGVGAGMRATTTDATFGVGHTVYVTVVDTSSDNNTEGFRMESNVRATISNSTALNNTLNGFDCFPGTASSDLNLESCISSNNKQWGVFAGNTGAFVGTIRISNVTVTNNSVQGLNPAGGSILSYNNNKVQGNGPAGTTNGSPTGPAPQS
ncbi:MAG TPA: right-handed parallel beta-helix repeat-containing protein [Pyrinomonadaceae bacterium]|jgi:hypothetical protein